MNNAAKLKALQKKSFLQKKIVDNLSSCLKSATDKEELSAIQSQLTASVKSAIKKVERTGSLSSSMNFDAEPNLIQDKFNHTFTLFSNPAIEKLEKKKAAVEHELWLKEKELRGSLIRTWTATDNCGAITWHVLEPGSYDINNEATFTTPPNGLDAATCIAISFANSSSPPFNIAITPIRPPWI